MKFEIAKKFLAGGAGGPSEQNSTVKLQAEGRQLRVDRESATLFAMKYAIGEILFLGVRCGMTFRPGTSMPRTTAESPSEGSHEVCDWQKLFFSSFAQVRSGHGQRGSARYDSGKSQRR